MSPANHAYLDMKYTRSTPLGQNWAGYTEVKKAYGWDPGAYVSGVPGVGRARSGGATVDGNAGHSADIDYLAFPRLAALAELGWSPGPTHNWTAFPARLGAQGPRWRPMGINYYRSSQVAWDTGGTTNPGTCTDPAWSATQVYTAATWCPTRPEVDGEVVDPGRGAGNDRPAGSMDRERPC